MNGVTEAGDDDLGSEPVILKNRHDLAYDKDLQRSILVEVEIGYFFLEGWSF